jgi:hypothetical protein
MCLITFLVFVVGWCICQKLGFTTLQLPLPVVWRIGFEIDWMQLSFLGAFFLRRQFALLLRVVRPTVRLGRNAAVRGLRYGDEPIRGDVCCSGSRSLTPSSRSRTEHPVLFRRLGKQSDVSYGIYIYAFPVQQSVASFAVPAGAGWIASLTVTSIVTFLLAALSWRYIERPALALKRHLFPRRADTTAKSSVDTPS